MKLDALTRRLGSAGVDASSLELAELLWLGARAERVPSAEAPEPTAREENTAPTPAVDLAPPPPSVEAGMVVPDTIPRGDVAAPAGRRAGGRLRRRAGLEPALPMMRALNRLGRADALGRPELDLAEAVRRSAASRVRQLAWRPARVPTTPLLVLEDAAGTMDPWRASIARMVDVARASGRFLRVEHRRVRLGPTPDTMAAGPPDAPDVVEHVPDAAGPEGWVVWWVSDGVGAGARNGRLHALLDRLRAARVAWVHPWGSEAMWRTPVRGLERAAGTVPLTTLDGAGLTALVPWARGAGSGGLPLLRLPPEVAPAASAAPGTAGTMDQAARVRRLTDRAGQAAGRLLGLAAAIPGRFDADLLLAVGEAAAGVPVGPLDLAQVLASGLLVRDTPGWPAIVRFVDEEARAAALGLLPRDRVPLVLAELIRALDAEVAARYVIPYELVIAVQEGRDPATGAAAPVAGVVALRAIVQLAGLWPKLTERTRAILGEARGATAPAPRTERIEPVIVYLGFASQDDEGGRISRFARLLEQEVRRVTGREDVRVRHGHERPGSDWIGTYEDLLGSAAFYVPILTPRFLQSSWCGREAGVLLGRFRVEGQAGRVVPVRLAEVVGPSREHPLLDELTASPPVEFPAKLLDPPLGTAARARVTHLAERIAAVLEGREPRPVATIIVDPTGAGNYPTISAAVQMAAPYSRIIVRPGTYAGGLVVAEPLEILGDGPREQIVVLAEGRSALRWTASEGHVRGLTLNQNGGSDGTWFSVDVADGSLVLENCAVTCRSLACVAVHGARLRMVECWIHDGAEAGVFIYSGGRGILESNIIERNQLAGVTVCDGATCVATKNLIKDGRAGGIFVRDDGGGSFRENAIEGNVLAGIEVRNGCFPSVSHNVINSGASCGLFIHSGAGGVYEDNTIESNRLCGVEVKSGAAPTLLRNRVHRNGYEGIYVHDGGRGIYEANDLRSNKRGAWDIDKADLPHIIRRDNIEDPATAPKRRR